MKFFKEFKPTILFLAKFIGLYIVGNLLYGWYVTAYHPKPDPVTRWVTQQTASALRTSGWDCEAHDLPGKATTYIELNNRAVISVFEGCNGLNVMIIFAAFLVAFGPITKSMAWFLPLGLLVIHLTNLGRIGLLFVVSLQLPDQFYFVHKYLFTAIIYVAVFLFWIWWVTKFALKNAKRHTA